MPKNLNPLIEAFVHKYGILRLLNDIGVRNIQKTGQSQIIASCPYHEDTKPSFSVNLDHGMFNCFACDKHGDLIEMIKLSYNLTYKNAIQFILSRSGLESNINMDDILFLQDIQNAMVEEEEEDSFSWPIISKEMIKRMYYSPDPYNYLLGRGFSQKTIEYFECGYAVDYLGKGYEQQPRVTIPGHNEYGKICGFIGRTPVNANPKYIYTAGYPKSHTLFNLHRAKKFSNQGLILVEGSLDAMRLHDLGYPNACAILGSALSVYQQRLLLKTTDKVYFMFDNDNSGYKANQNAIEAMKDQLDVYFIPLKIKKLNIEFNDPGDINCSNLLNILFDNAISWSNFIFNKTIKL
jgi:DNA primase